MIDQRTTWTVNPDLETVAQWIDEDDEDTYADRIEGYTVEMANGLTVTEENVDYFGQRLTDWIYANDADLAELHAQWNENNTDKEIRQGFFEGVRDTLGASANLF